MDSRPHSSKQDWLRSRERCPEASETRSTLCLCMQQNNRDGARVVRYDSMRMREVQWDIHESRDKGEQARSRQRARYQSRVGC